MHLYLTVVTLWSPMGSRYMNPVANAEKFSKSYFLDIPLYTKPKCVTSKKFVIGIIAFQF